MTGIFERLAKANKEGRHLCVGLDPKTEHVAKIFGSLNLMNFEERLFEYARDIAYNSGSVAACFKLNFEFWSKHQDVLREVIAFLKHTFPHAPLILDRKFGDIGATSAESVSFVKYLGVDAVTANPYMGVSDVSSKFAEAGIPCFMLVRTSNKDSDELQELLVERGGATRFLYEVVAELVAKRGGAMGAVVGATKAEAFSMLARRVPSFDKVPLLIPGVGTQGGDLEAVVKALKGREGPWVVNVGSGIAETTDNPDAWNHSVFTAAQYYYERMRAY